MICALRGQMGMRWHSLPDHCVGIDLLSRALTPDCSEHFELIHARSDRP